MQQKRGATVTPTNGPVSLRHHRETICLLDAVRLSCFLPFPTLPPVMRERPVGFRHPVRVFLFLDRLALALRGEDQLRREPLRHVLLLAGAAVLNDPAH